MIAPRNPGRGNNGTDRLKAGKSFDEERSRAHFRTARHKVTA